MAFNFADFLQLSLRLPLFASRTLGAFASVLISLAMSIALDTVHLLAQMLNFFAELPDGLTQLIQLMGYAFRTSALRRTRWMVHAFALAVTMLAFTLVMTTFAFALAVTMFAVFLQRIAFEVIQFHGLEGAVLKQLPVTPANGLDRLAPVADAPFTPPEKPFAAQRLLSFSEQRRQKADAVNLVLCGYPGGFQ